MNANITPELQKAIELTVEEVLAKKAKLLLTVANIPDLLEIKEESLFNGQAVYVTEFWPHQSTLTKLSGYKSPHYLSASGGIFIWDANCPKSEHNGGTIINPRVSWKGEQSELKNFLSGQKGGNNIFIEEIHPTTGCWVRSVADDSEVLAVWFGATEFDGQGNLADSHASLQAAIKYAAKLGSSYRESKETANRDKGITVRLPAFSCYISKPIILPRGGATRGGSVHLIGAGFATSTLLPTSTSNKFVDNDFPAERALIEWEEKQERLFYQKIKDFKIALALGINHKAIWYKLAKPAIPVDEQPYQPYMAEEIKELDLDILIEAENVSHKVLVDIEGKAKFSRIIIHSDISYGPKDKTYQRDNTIVLRTSSPVQDSSGNIDIDVKKRKHYAITDNAGINYSIVELHGVNARGGRSTMFQGRLNNCTIPIAFCSTGAFEDNSVLNLKDSALNTFENIFSEGREEKPQIRLENCHYNTFRCLNLGHHSGDSYTDGIQLIDSDDNMFACRASAIGKPGYNYSYRDKKTGEIIHVNGKLIRIGKNCHRNKFLQFGNVHSFDMEVENHSLPEDGNVIEYIREDEGN